MLLLEPPLQPLLTAGWGRDTLCLHFPVPTPTFDILWDVLEWGGWENPVSSLNYASFSPRVSCFASMEGCRPWGKVTGAKLMREA